MHCARVVRYIRCLLFLLLSVHPSDETVSSCLETRCASRLKKISCVHLVQLVFSPLLVVALHHSPAMWEPLESGRSVCLIATPKACNCRIDLLATHCVKNGLWCNAPPVSCARPKSNRTQACTSGCIGSHDIWGACFQRTSSIDNHQKLCSGGPVASQPVGKRARFTSLPART